MATSEKIYSYKDQTFGSEREMVMHLLDDYRCVDGLWRFARRKVTLDGAVPGSWAG